MRAGFIGLGNIGKPMALQLANTGGVLVFDIAAEPVAELVSAGAKAAKSVAELAAHCDVSCLMVNTEAQVREVFEQIIVAAHPGHIVVIHATISVAVATELAELGQKHDVAVLDAPVSGGAIAAATGDLALMVGGNQSTLELARPVLQRLSSLIVHCGAVGAGTKMKLARNLIHFVAFTGATEGLRLAEAAGLNLQDLGKIVRHTDAITGGVGAIMHRDNTAPIPVDDFWYAIFNHVRQLGEKDLALAAQLAKELQISVPLTELSIENLATGLGVSNDRNV